MYLYNPRALIEINYNAVKPFALGCAHVGHVFAKLWGKCLGAAMVGLELYHQILDDQVASSHPDDLAQKIDGC